MTLPSASSAQPVSPTAIGERLRSTVPMVDTLGIKFGDVTPHRAIATLPDDPALYNHVGGPHAGALFSLGETASGAVVLAAFHELLDRVVPLTVQARISYRKFAQDTVSATAVLREDRTEIMAELENGRRPEFDVAVTIERIDGVVAAEMTVTWTLKPNR